MHDLFKDETTQARKGHEHKRRTQESLRVAMQNVLRTEDGKRVLCWIIDQTGVFAASFTGNSTTFFNEGKRSVGIRLYHQLMQAEPCALQKLAEFMREEKAQEEKTHV